MKTNLLLRSPVSIGAELRLKNGGKMRYYVRLSIFLLSCTVFAGNALAKDGFWGWLEDFSGPGPFKGESLELFKLCQTAKTGAATTDARGEPGVEGATIPGISRNWSVGTTRKNTWCLWADQRFFNVPEDKGQGYPNIQAYMFDQGVSYSVLRFVSVGAGVGLTRFVSHPTAGSDLGTYRFTITPVRITVHPLNFFFAIKNPRSDRQQIISNALSVPQFYWKPWVCFPGKLEGNDFGQVPDTFSSGGECKNSWGVQFNFFELLKR